MSKNKLSVVLAVYNEEKNIQRCLRSVKPVADEIIVVDGSSTDKTREIAKKIGARVIKTTNKKMFHINKQTAINHAQYNWVLLMDADEKISQKLADEIKSLIINGQLSVNGYWIPRKNIIFKKWIKHTGWWPDYQLRLFKKDTLHFPCQSVHEHPKLKGKSARLKNPLIHYHYSSVSQYLKRLDRYTDNDRDVFIKQNQELKWQDFLIKPADEFIKRFVAWEGYKDGLHGLVLSLLQSFFQFVVCVKVWEEKGFQKKGINNFLFQTKKILKKKMQEYQWWMLENCIKYNESVFYKFLCRLKRFFNIVK